MINTHDYAKNYIENGLSPIPITRGRKNPARAKWQHEQYCIDDIPNSFASDGNIGVKLGNGIVDIDLDCEYARTLAPYFLSDTARFGRPSSPSSHWIYSVSSDIKYEKFSDSKGVILEIRSTPGQHTIFPPSTHEDTGELISWETEISFQSIGSSELVRSCRMLAAAVVVRKHWHQGIRDELRTTLTCLMLKNGFNEQDTDDFVNAIALSAGDEHKAKATYQATRLAEDLPSFGIPTLEKLIPRDYERVLKWLGIKTNALSIIPPLTPSGDVGEITTVLTDSKLAHYFARAFVTRARYCQESRVWMIYSGTHWTDKSLGGMGPLINEFISLLYQGAAKLQGQQRQEVIAQVLKFEAHKNQRSMLACAQGIPNLCIHQYDFDTKPMLLNVINGTINLETGTLEPHNSDDLITKLIQVEHDENATCPVFEEFLYQIFGGNESIIRYVQRFFGYCLTGKTTEHVLLFLYGLGSNGKSTLVKILQMILCEYATTSKSDLLMHHKTSDNSYQLAALKGKRLVAVSEFEDGAKIAEADLKTLTGGDEVASRAIYHEVSTWTPNFKIILSGNHKPEIKGVDEGIWRRIHLIHFGVTITPEQRDPHLIDKMEKELPGILNWALKGCLEWQRIGLAPPPEVLHEIEEYRQSENCLQQWIRECCDLDDDYTVSLASLVESYNEYNGERISPKKLSKMLTEAGFNKTKSSTTQFIGLTLSLCLA